MKRVFLFFLLSLALSAAWAQPTAGSGLDLFLSLQENRIPLLSAHRGGRFLPGYPENAIETFQHVLQQVPAIIECDVNMTRDSVLVLLHDNSLDRTTTGSGKISEKNWGEIKTLKLKDDYGKTTPYRIPELSNVLRWARQRAVLTLDVKRGVPFEKVIAAVEEAGIQGQVAIITYNLEDALLVHQLASEIKISANIRNEEELGAYLAAGLPGNKLLAFTGVSERPLSFYSALREAGIPAIIGTMGNLDNRAMARGPHVYRDLFEAGADIFATDRPLQAKEAFSPYFK